LNFKPGGGRATTSVAPAANGGSHTHRELDATDEPQLLETPFTPDTAPPGLAIRRSWWVAPLLLVAFGLAAVALQPHFTQMTYHYGRFIRNLSQDTSLRLPKQASITVRPLFASLLLLFTVFAAGSWTRRLRLGVTALGLYVALTILVDVVMARLSESGGPSPFMAYGNVIAGLVGMLVVAIAVFGNARLPGDVRVHRKLPIRWTPLFILGFSTLVSVVAAWAVGHFFGSYIHAHLDNLPLLGGSGSAVVAFFVTIPLALCIFGAIVERFKKKPLPGSLPSVAFIVPARDEEGMIGDTIDAIAVAAAAYPGDVQAIVIENGSSDDTVLEAEAAFECHPDLDSLLVHCPPLGKSRALNVGLSRADADIIVRIDADTLVAPELLNRAIPHFWDPEVGGVGSLPLPREDRGWIAHMRAIETYYGAAFKRVAQNYADCVTVLPGATVAYRRSLLLELGGFAEGVNGEDADITVRVGRLGYKVVADRHVLTYTDVPRNLSQLREQRMRWSRGLYHMIGRNRSAISMRQGVRGLWMLPWACFMMFRKLMLVPFAVAAGAMIIAQPSTLPLHEIAAAGAIVIGVQLFQMIAVVLFYRQPRLVMVLPSYLVFRLIVTYYALETLLTLAFDRPLPETQQRPVLTLIRGEDAEGEETEPIPIPINAEA
jgi:cellulose synthase/poly-beta-1,6-N-acetylglucosamine synthase-like glycosyltransferase